MKRYKIITKKLKWFGLNYGDEIVHDDNLWIHTDKTSEIESSSIISQKETIETCLKIRPGWFEEIEKNKDWEILEFQSTEPFPCFRFIRIDDNRYEPISPNGFPNTKEYFLNSNNHRIYTVKRLSDGEIFTVSDIINTHKNITPKIITKIEILNNEIIIWANCKIFYLNDISHVET